MSPQVSLLFTGLTMEYSKTINPETDTAKFAQMLKDSIHTLDSIPNLYHQRFDLDPSAPRESPNSLDSFKKLIREGPPHGGIWDAQLIGMAIRRFPKLTVLFEDIINTISSSSGGKTKLLFSTSGDDHWEAVKRQFPELNLGDKPAA